MFASRSVRKLRFHFPSRVVLLIVRWSFEAAHCGCEIFNLGRSHSNLLCSGMPVTQICFVQGCQHPRLNISHQQWSHWATREGNWNRNLSRSDLIAHSKLLVHISTKRTPPSMSRSRKWVHSTLSSMAKTGNWNRNSALHLYDFEKVGMSVELQTPGEKCRVPSKWQELKTNCLSMYLSSRVAISTSFAGMLAGHSQNSENSSFQPRGL